MGAGACAKTIRKEVGVGVKGRAARKASKTERNSPKRKRSDTRRDWWVVLIPGKDKVEFWAGKKTLTKMSVGEIPAYPKKKVGSDRGGEGDRWCILHFEKKGGAVGGKKKAILAKIGERRPIPAAPRMKGRKNIPGKQTSKHKKR